MKFPAVIKSFVLKDSSATEMYTKIVRVLKKYDPSFPKLHQWVFEFQRDRTFVETELRSKQPKTATGINQKSLSEYKIL